MNIINKFHNWRRKKRWNTQYKNGRWDNLRGKIEIERYKTIVDICKNYAKPNPSIIAMGCGEGILLDHLQSMPYSDFLGMDFSEVCIATAKQKTHPNSEFICADIHTFVPKKTYDVIVYNEVFYYVQAAERQQVLNTALDHLSEKGIIIVSMFRDGKGAWTFFENPKLQEVQSVTIENDEKENMYWKIATYTKKK
ncbi:class I SAM-dependent methyltransferase [Aquimarina agarivorans]|uniref:class I SAM-dependent methyltransferase n=1 Tax=Aquimarina agarivorans TaxID=980584 RepID=UPI000248E894|nr:class I SAM-dependent methyltransferase [Aquimarina agarivorans]